MCDLLIGSREFHENPLSAFRCEASQVKAKVTLEQATMAQRGSRCIAVLFLLPRRYMWVGGQRHVPAALPPEKDPLPTV